MVSGRMHTRQDYPTTVGTRDIVFIGALPRIAS